MIMSDIFMFIVAMVGSIIALVFVAILLSFLTMHSHWGFLAAFLAGCLFGAVYLYKKIDYYY